MPSKMVIDREKSARPVESAARLQAIKVAQAFEQLSTSVLSDNETVPDIALLQHIVSRLLDQHRLRLIAADEAHLTAISIDRGLRQQRDVAATELYEKLLKIREIFKGVYGVEATQAFFAIDGSIQPDPVVLARLAERTLAILSDPEYLPPRTLADGVLIDVTALAASIVRPLEDLQRALASLSDERRRTDQTLIAKNEALASFDSCYMRSARLLEALYALTGLDQLRDRLRAPKPRSSTPRAAGEHEPPAELVGTVDDATDEEENADLPNDPLPITAEI